VLKNQTMRLANRKKLVGRWISLINRYTQIYFSKELKPFELGPGQAILLGEIFSGEGKSQDELSALIKIDKATAARSLAKLEDRGYIIRQADPADNRIRRVYLTAKAKKVAPTFFAIFNAWSQNLVRDFSREEKQQLLSLLERMGQNAMVMLEK
jgi:DNA-binding MarR family transcriptional regulator